MYFDQFSIDKKIYFIAEIGINHNGDIEFAKQLIDMAVRCDCDAVKFQKRDIETVYSKEILDSPRESPWGKTQRDQKMALEFGIKEYDLINDYCQEKNIDWFVSSWDNKSQKLMNRYNFKFNKVASAMATNYDFLECVAAEKKPTFLSTGMTNINEIEKAIQIFKKHNCEIMLFHTVSTYPALEEDLNLACINSLGEKFNLPIGYSGHEPSVSPSIIACSMGAAVIERHITLDRAMYGSDQSASLQEDGLSNLVKVLRKLPKILGDGKKIILEKEEEVAKKLRYWQN
ncbi:MAG: N-acetylneuraminate synthase [Pelagibacteraceae bacterium TMED124]|nr:MAG: N-acetylneuraminate synthase [Pelagibacteraceae bacterium TMED124]